MKQQNKQVWTRFRFEDNEGLFHKLFWVDGGLFVLGGYL
jgi:hypothetical protein